MATITVYLLVDDFGSNGRSYRETDADTADLETVIVDLLDGQYDNPVRVVASNTFEGWSQDVVRVSQSKTRAAPQQ